MIVAIGDTHTAIWFLSTHPNLSVRAKAFIDASNNSGDQIGLSSISLVEIVYLVEKGRLPVETWRLIVDDLDSDVGTFVEIPVTRGVVTTMRRVSRDQIPDMPDRIIAATALHRGVPVISRDGKIRTSEIETIW